ncbi:hypothetical protein IFM89_025054 [Coptis chinensis]|uniref:Fe2OG dioxygenase domain-containing protein n=1 Tax=Coptis chinensis TaxID=261450 RepID=A0A835I7S7_9MAGN|nr:hypothetical protein IFM89_025054 [Coptis chinensis]
MAAATASVHVETSLIPLMGYVKDLATQSNKLGTIPSDYDYSTIRPEDYDTDQHVVAQEQVIPTIDFSLLASNSPKQRSRVIQDLANACRDWGFFMVINHGVPEKLREDMLNAFQNFFDLTEEEKLECAGKHVLDPIRCGTSFNANVEKVFFWRDFLKVLVHPQFHSPSEPPNFSHFGRDTPTNFAYYNSEISLEYCKRTRQVVRELLKAISESLGLEECYIDKVLELESGLQILTGNLYPPCPQPELAMGMPPHSDHGLLTLLIENEIGGLQLKHNGKWINVQALPNSFLVNTGDHLEILSNGKYKSVLHRAVVNSKATRISLAMAHGPCFDKIVTPAPELVDCDKNPPAYLGMRYKEYLELQQSNPLNGKSCLDRVRL